MENSFQFIFIFLSKSFQKNPPVKQKATDEIQQKHTINFTNAFHNDLVVWISSSSNPSIYNRLDFFTGEVDLKNL
jgi:hypothetical protein